MVYFNSSQEKGHKMKKIKNQNKTYFNVKKHNEWLKKYKKSIVQKRRLVKQLRKKAA